MSIKQCLEPKKNEIKNFLQAKFFKKASMNNDLKKLAFFLHS